MIPTSIDGTDITGATIDGTDVTEISVDGQTVFTAEIPQPPSGVARWTFDNADTSGSTAIDVWNNNDGTINGATTGVSGANQTYNTNEAYSFDGIDDAVEVPNGLISVSPYSIAAWFRTPSAAGSANDYVWRFRGDTDSLVGQGVNEPNTENLQVWIDSNSAWFDTGVAIDDNLWRHGVETYNGSTIKFYIDGTEELSVSASKTDRGESNNYFGNASVNGNAPFDGDIDDPRVYNKVLSPNEVSNLYNNGSI